MHGEFQTRVGVEKIHQFATRSFPNVNNRRVGAFISETMAVLLYGMVHGVN